MSTLARLAGSLIAAIVRLTDPFRLPYGVARSEHTWAWAVQQAAAARDHGEAALLAEAEEVLRDEAPHQPDQDDLVIAVAEAILRAFADRIDHDHDTHREGDNQ